MSSACKSNGGGSISFIIVISIIVSALVVRAIYTLFEYVKLLSDECIGGKEDDYEEMICGLIRTLLVIAVCVFFIIIIYEYIKRHHISS